MFLTSSKMKDQQVHGPHLEQPGSGPTSEQSKAGMLVTRVNAGLRGTWFPLEESNKAQVQPKRAELPHVGPLPWPRRPGHQERQPLSLLVPH